MSIDDREGVTELLSKAYKSLRCTDSAGALSFLDQALKLEFENQEVLWALKCLNFWMNSEHRLENLPTNFERGAFLMMEWKSFLGFTSKLGSDFEKAWFAFKHFAFSRALGQFRSVSKEEKEAHIVELSLAIGRSLKGLGDYESALPALETACRDRKDDAEILAELADTRALAGDLRSAKALFREAFFVAPQRIDLDLLESEMMRILINRVVELGFSGALLAEWIPVYGTLHGVFSVKRELKSVEIGKLRNSIYQLENEMTESHGRQAVLVPRLINHYFWLVDHYVANHEEHKKIQEVLLKIKLLDPAIHKLYVA